MDFKKSLTVGLDAAKAARKNKEEIQNLIEDLNHQVQEFSNGLVSLEVTNEQKFNKNVNPLATGLVALVGINSSIKYNALSLKLNNKGMSRREVIAEWKINESDGYPCVISYNGKDVNCRSKETLERALNDLLSNASTGERMLQLIDEAQPE